MGHTNFEGSTVPELATPCRWLPGTVVTSDIHRKRKGRDMRPFPFCTDNGQYFVRLESQSVYTPLTFHLFISAYYRIEIERADSTYFSNAF